MHDFISKKKNTSAEPLGRPRKANECLADARQHKPAEKLFDEFWREGELALMFGAQGTGKSVLAMQVAERIARGGGIDGFDMSARRQKVLYVDLRLSDAQFVLRYGDHKFSENLYRGRPDSNDRLVEWLRQMITENGFRAVVIDDLSAIRQTYDGTRETLKLMRDLRQLKDELGVSMLVVAGSREPRRGGPVSEADMMRSRVLGDFADSVFAVGMNPRSPGDRYIIQTRVQSAAIVWHAGNAPVCRMSRTDDGFLGFTFDERFVAEIDEATRQLILNIKWRHDAGASYRLIAEDFGISKTKAARLCKKWTPEMEKRTIAEAAARGNDHDADDEFDDDEFEAEESLTAKQEDDSVAEAAGSRSEPGAPLLSEEGWPEAGVVGAAGGQIVEQDPTDWPPADLATPLGDAPAGAPDGDPDVPPGLSDLKRGVDGYGREIFIEKDGPLGKPDIWYQYNDDGKLYRKQRKLYSVSIERVDGMICLFNTT